MNIHVRAAHHRCQAQSVAQDTEQTHGKHFPSAFIEFVFFLFVIFTLFKRVATFVCQRVLQHWTMVKLVLLQIVADVFVDVGHILGATADTMLDTE